MSESPEPGAVRPTTRPVGQNVHESYSFACMRCGYGWEQSYEIEHHLDVEGKPFVVYLAGGARVPSPLSEPTCGNCDGHVVRILRPGRVSTAREWMHRGYAGRPASTPAVPAASSAGAAGRRAAAARRTSIAASLAASLPEAPVGEDAGSLAGSSGDAAGSGGARRARVGSGTRRHWHLTDLLHPFRHHRVG